MIRKILLAFALMLPLAAHSGAARQEYWGCGGVFRVFGFSWSGPWPEPHTITQYKGFFDPDFSFLTGFVSPDGCVSSPWYDTSYRIAACSSTSGPLETVCSSFSNTIFIPEEECDGTFPD